MPVLKIKKNGVWEHIGGVSGHTHETSEIVDFPSSMPADGGNADTLDGKHANEFATVQDINGFATESFVTNKIAEAQLNAGDTNIDLGGLATKDELNAVSILIGDTAVSEQIAEAINRIDYPVDSVNGKTGHVQLSASDINAYSKAEIDNMVFITVDDIDTICGTTIQMASEVTF